MRLATAIILLVSALSANADGVKYRGIFVNDEDWSLRPWAVKHFGKKEQIGIRAYEEIFSLMEKDGLNLIWPAMHEGGYEFSSRPENLELAKKHGIVVGTSHCEPMLRNNCYLSKEDKKKWSWTTNRDFLVDYWKEGVRRGTGNGEWGTGILWTIGMRGIHDGKMQDGKTTEEKIKILEEVFAAQCAMLPEGAPKLFVPYKEVLPIFNAGLKVPKDTTIMWTNDNFGYIRRIGAGSSNAANQPTKQPSNQPIKQSNNRTILLTLKASTGTSPTTVLRMATSTSARRRPRSCGTSWWRSAGRTEFATCGWSTPATFFRRRCCSMPTDASPPIPRRGAQMRSQRRFRLG